MLTPVLVQAQCRLLVRCLRKVLRCRLVGWIWTMELSYPPLVLPSLRSLLAPYDPSMIRSCRREYSCVEGDLRCLYAILPADDYDISVLDIVIVGSLRGLLVAEVVKEDCDHCVVRVTRSHPRDDGDGVYYISIF